MLYIVPQCAQFTDKTQLLEFSWYGSQKKFKTI